MSQKAATLADCATALSSDIDLMEPMRAEREQLTHLLRALAAELDELDRRLSEIAWRLTAGHARGVHAGVDRERSALMVQRDGLTRRLQGLASRLRDIDVALSNTPAHSSPINVGTCPDCGYPSLCSGLCASCRLYLVR